MSLTRIQKLMNAKTLFYWSIKNRKLVKLSAKDFGKSMVKCDVCVPTYHHQGSSKGCHMKFGNLIKYVEHITKRELRYHRPLIWLSESDVPEDVDREREVGDLKTLENDVFYKVVWNGKAKIQSKNDLLNAMKFACPCSDSCYVRCKSMQNVYNHLAVAERRTGEYIIFKVDENQIKPESTDSANNIIDQPDDENQNLCIDCDIDKNNVQLESDKIYSSNKSEDSQQSLPQIEQSSSNDQLDQASSNPTDQVTSDTADQQKTSTDQTDQASSSELKTIEFCKTLSSPEKSVENERPVILIPIETNPIINLSSQQQQQKMATGISSLDLKSKLKRGKICFNGLARKVSHLNNKIQESNKNYSNRTITYSTKTPLTPKVTIMPLGPIPDSSDSLPIKLADGRILRIPPSILHSSKPVIILLPHSTSSEDLNLTVSSNQIFSDLSENNNIIDINLPIHSENANTSNRQQTSTTLIKSSELDDSSILDIDEDTLLQTLSDQSIFNPSVHGNTSMSSNITQLRTIECSSTSISTHEQDIERSFVSNSETKGIEELSITKNQIQFQNSDIISLNSDDDTNKAQVSLENQTKSDLMINCSDDLIVIVDDKETVLKRSNPDDELCYSKKFKLL